MWCAVDKMPSRCNKITTKYIFFWTIYRIKQENKENKNIHFQCVMHISFVICLCIIVHVYIIRKTTGHVKRARAHEFYLHHCYYICSESNIYAYPNSFSLKRWKKVGYPFFSGFIVILKNIAAFPNAIYRPNTCIFVTNVIQQMGRTRYMCITVYIL